MANPTGTSGRVLVVEDSPTVLEWLIAVLGTEFEIATASSLATARGQLARGGFHAVVTDYELGDGTGIELLTYATTSNDKIAGILMTAHKEDDTVRALQKSGRTLVLFKPVDANQLIAWVKNAVTMAKLADAATKISSGAYKRPTGKLTRDPPPG